MHPRGRLVLLGVIATAQASVLRVTKSGADDEAKIVLDQTHIRSTCGSGAASIKYFEPSPSVSLHSAEIARGNVSVRAYLSGVPYSCHDQDITTPCYSPNPTYPSLFHCAWVGAAGEYNLGPFKASVESDILDGMLLGYSVFVVCTTPALSVIRQIAGSSFALKLSIRHGDPDANPTILSPPAIGSDSFSFVQFPPPPPAPAAPPPRGPGPVMQCASDAAGYTNTGLATSDVVGTYVSSCWTIGDQCATKTLDGITSSYWLSASETKQNQWLILYYPDPKTVWGIKVWPGQTPYGVKTMTVQYGDSINGPWTTIWSTNSIPACSSAGACENAYDFGADTYATAKFWRLADINSHGGANNRPKIMNLQFKRC